MSRQRFTHFLKTGRLAPRGRNKGCVGSRPGVCPFWGTRSRVPGHAVAPRRTAGRWAGAGLPYSAESPDRRLERRMTLSFRAGGGR